MKTFTLTLLFLTSIITVSSATTWTIETNGFVFSPATLTISEGDTVVFSIDGIHNAVEVSAATWTANGTTPLNGGFAVGFGGGTVLPANLPVGTHFYVCQPHAGGGMKGQIIVQETTSVDEGLGLTVMNVFPNPSNGKVYVSLDKSISGQNFNIDVINLSGKVVYNSTRAESNDTKEFDLSALPSGIYVIRLSGDDTTYRRKIIIN